MAPELRCLGSVAHDAAGFVFNADTDVRSADAIEKLRDVGSGPLDIGSGGGMRPPQESEYADQIRIENVGGFNGTLEEFDVLFDFFWLVQVALEDRRRAAGNGEPGVFRTPRDGFEVRLGEVFERAAEEAADFDAVELEVFGETNDSIKLLGDFIGKDG